MSISLSRKISIALRMTGKSGTPRFASLFVTRNCNFNCPYCKSIDRPFKNIDLAEWKRVIDRLYKFGCRLFTLTGGEPLTRVDIVDLVHYISVEKKAVCWMISNFGLMTEKKIDELAGAGLQFLTCSLDSLSDAGEKSDGSVLDRLGYAKEKGVIPSTLTVITKENIGEVPALLKTVVSRGIIFDIGLYQCVGGLFSPADSGPKVSDKDELEQLVRLLCRTKITTGFVAPSLTYLRSIEKHYENSDWKCSGTTDEYLVINNNGSLMACQEYDTGIPVFAISSLEDAAWRTAKESAVQLCKGCYYGCYYQKSHVNKTDALFDAWTMLRV